MTQSKKKIVHAVAIGVSALVLFGCVEDGGDPDPKVDGTSVKGFGSRYYPLAQGNSWQYETVMSGGSKFSDTYTVVSASAKAAIVKFDSTAFVVSGQYTNLNYVLSGADMSATGASYSHCSGEGFTYTPPLPVHLPDSSLGTKVSFSTTARVFPPCFPTSYMWTETETSNVIGPETVTVPAGTFNAIRMEGTSYGQNGIRTDFVKFVADGVGIVKSRTTAYLPVIGSSTTESVLRLYSVGGGG